MDAHQKEIVEQVAGITIATADITCRLVFRLVNLKKLDAAEALLILGDFHGHFQDLARRNSHVPGSAVAYRAVADRVKAHMDQLQKEVGKKPQSPS
jgi:hypothetical protein